MTGPALFVIYTSQPLPPTGPCVINPDTRLHSFIHSFMPVCVRCNGQCMEQPFKESGFS